MRWNCRANASVHSYLPHRKKAIEVKSEHQQSVEQFMRLARQEVPASPVIPSLEIRRLRAKLILEEALETVEALGFTVEGGISANNFDLVAEYPADIIEVIDGCCDIEVVTTGTLSAFGIPDMPFINAVNANNIAKFNPGHSWREDGKLIKHPGHKAPDIAGILETLR